MVKIIRRIATGVPRHVATQMFSMVGVSTVERDTIVTLKLLPRPRRPKEYTSIVQVVSEEENELGATNLIFRGIASMKRLETFLSTIVNRNTNSKSHIAKLLLRKLIMRFMRLSKGSTKELNNFLPTTRINSKN